MICYDFNLQYRNDVSHRPGKQQQTITTNTKQINKKNKIEWKTAIMNADENSISRSIDLHMHTQAIVTKNERRQRKRCLFYCSYQLCSSIDRFDNYSGVVMSRDCLLFFASGLMHR